MRKSAFIFAALIAFSCSDDDNDQQALSSYDNGILVLNEGGTGEITFISNDLQDVRQDIFSAVNGSSVDLGQFVQSMFFDGENAFIISNGSNKITVVNRYSMEYIATISTGLQVPRYGAVLNGKAYVTNQASFGSADDDYVAVIDLTDFSVETPIDVDGYAERIIAANNKIYVAGGAFGMGDKVSVIDPSGAVIGTIDTGIAPSALEESNGIVYVLCSNLTDNSKIMRISTTDDSVIDEIGFPGSMINAQNLDIEGGFMYFNIGSKVYRSAVGNASIPSQPLFDTLSTSPYIGYGFAVNGNRIYISEAAADFSSSGKVLIYSVNGEKIWEGTAGLGPNGFYFN